MKKEYMIPSVTLSVVDTNDVITVSTLEYVTSSDFDSRDRHLIGEFFID